MLEEGNKPGEGFGGQLMIQDASVPMQFSFKGGVFQHLDFPFVDTGRVRQSKHLKSQHDGGSKQ